MPTYHMEKNRNEILETIKYIKSFQTQFPKQFTKKTIAKFTGLSERSVHYYTDKGLVEPSIENPGIRGKYRIYGWYNLLDFEVIKHLTAFGFRLANISKITAVVAECRQFVYDTYKFNYENPYSGTYMLIGYSTRFNKRMSKIEIEIDKEESIKILTFVYGSDLEKLPKDIPPPVRVIEMKSKTEEPQLAFFKTNLVLIINLTRISLNAFLNFCHKIENDPQKENS